MVLGRADFGKKRRKKKKRVHDDDVMMKLEIIVWLVSWLLGSCILRACVCILCGIVIILIFAFSLLFVLYSESPEEYCLAKLLLFRDKGEQVLVASSPWGGCG